jgi:hypothetical protein
VASCLCAYDVLKLLASKSMQRYCCSVSVQKTEARERLSAPVIPTDVCTVQMFALETTAGARGSCLQLRTVLTHCGAVAVKLLDPDMFSLVHELGTPKLRKMYPSKPVPYLWTQLRRSLGFQPGDREHTCRECSKTCLLCRQRHIAGFTEHSDADDNALDESRNFTDEDGDARYPTHTGPHSTPEKRQAATSTNSSPYNCCSNRRCFA